MSYRMRGMGQLPLSAQQKIAPSVPTVLLAPEQQVSAIQTAAASLVPPGCSTLQALAEMRAWKSPPSTIPAGGVLVWGHRLTSAATDSDGRGIADLTATSIGRAARAAGLLATAGGTWRISTVRGYVRGERIAWVAVRVNGGTVSQSRLNSIVNGAFEAKVRTRGGMPWTPVVPIYLAPTDVPEDAALRTQVYIASALHSVLTWEDFRAAVAVDVFGVMNLTTNVTSRTRTPYGLVQHSLGVAQRADQTAAQAEQLAQEAVAFATEYSRTNEPDDSRFPCPGNPEKTCHAPGPRAQARLRLEQARQIVSHARDEIEAGLRAAAELEAQIAEVQSTLQERMRAAIEATARGITEQDELRRRYIECAIWKNADVQYRAAAARLAAESAQAPALIASLQTAARAAQERLQQATQNIDASAEEAERRAGGSLGPMIPTWAWGALAVGAVSFIGLAFFLRRSRQKRATAAVTQNRRRRRRRF